MYVSTQARQLLNAWAAFSRGVGKPLIVTTGVALAAEYAIEKNPKRSPEKLVSLYLSGNVKFDQLEHDFMRFVGVNIEKLDPKRVAAERLYELVASNLFVSDWARPSPEFVTKELYEYGEKFLKVADKAIEQCRIYGGRHWQYFKKVCEQSFATGQAEEQEEVENVERLKLDPGHFDRLAAGGSVTSIADHLEKFSQELEVKNDERLLELNATEPRRTEGDGQGQSED